MSRRQTRHLTPSQLLVRQARLHARNARRAAFRPPSAGGLRDLRLRKRLRQLQFRAERRPGASFPQMFRNEAELEGAYRFFQNRRVSLHAVLDDHVQATVKAIAALGRSYVLHDSSWFTFGGDTVREGMGRVSKGKRDEGFQGHFALAVSADGRRLPQGLLGVSTQAFTGPPKGKRSHKVKLADPTRKSLRWGQMVRQTRQATGPDVQLVHLMDREADDYALFEQMVEERERFIIRLRYDRGVWPEDEGASNDDERKQVKEALSVVLSRQEHVVERDVPLSPRSKDRPPPNLKIHPARDARTAKLSIRAAKVMLPRPKSRPDCTQVSLAVNVVQVIEREPPEGEEPVEWTLITSEPIETVEQVEAIVDGYRTRWVIEEFFKALKTGCAYESRQLESLHALKNALGLLAPIAVGILRVRNVARDTPNAPAEDVLTPLELQVLRHFSERHTLPKKATALDVMLAIAGLGGHLKRNGMPGWLTLYRGYAELTANVAGWQAALASRSDES